ncbi:ECF transporter S component [Paeniglutamicibacter psychrophenolicus]|uniref:Energy-coupling factor transport system substrate-specific component n=1 Tax=Paeniglutamicibacter psychrophenolicus TaxID=257454 RepID=A0ABS4WBX1_9MICC|nr:ECF transporter S component [Paeniglutamicibacter psychrophenolicus]MBP2373700.1 energy-coupling factor transport system substrate-specific component [Paeniglutamicibacter psychrophenolicus]
MGITHQPAGHKTATTSWRVVDIVIAAVIAVSSGVIFWAWNSTHHLLDVLFLAFPPSAALVSGMWLFPAVLGALIIRKPGAALFCELVAAMVSALMGSEFGLTVLASGLIQGLGAEAVFAAFRYRTFNLPVALLAGAGAGLFGSINDTFIFRWFPEYTTGMLLAYIGFMTISGIVIAGLLSFLGTRALAKTGALGALASRKAATEPILG